MLAQLTFPQNENYQIQMVIRRSGMQCRHTLGCEGIGAEEDPLLVCRQQGACHLPLLFARIGFFGLRMEKELCNGKSKGEHKCDFSAITWKYIFIAEVDMGRFIEPRRNKVQLIEGERPFQESRRPRVAKRESSG